MDISSIDKVEFETVLEKPLKVYHRQSQHPSTVQTWEMAEYPNNHFKLTYENIANEIMFSLKVSGPPIGQMSIQVVKEDYDFASDESMGNQEEFSRTFTNVNKKTDIKWKAINCDQMIMSAEKGHGNAKLKVLTIFLKIAISLPSQEKIEKEDPKMELLKKFASVCNIGAFNIDVVVEHGNSRPVRFKASKVVLAAYSPVFNKLIEYDSLNEKRNMIQIRDFEPLIVEKLLTFLKTLEADFTNDIELTEKMLMIGGSYEIEELKKICQPILMDNISSGNVSNYVCLAHSSKCDELKAGCIQYMRNNIKNFCNSPEWSHIMKFDVGLSAEIYTTLRAH